MSQYNYENAQKALAKFPNITHSKKNCFKTIR